MVLGQGLKVWGGGRVSDFRVDGPRALGAIMRDLGCQASSLRSCGNT